MTNRVRFTADDIQPAIGRILAQLAQLREQTDRPFNARVSVTAHGLVGGDDDRRRAHGGPVWPGVWTVGENGPETLVVGPGMSGHVYADGGRAGPRSGSLRRWGSAGRQLSILTIRFGCAETSCEANL